MSLDQQAFVDSLHAADGPVAVAAAIQAQLDAVAASGGGRVVLPPGQWESVGLKLRSNLEVYLDHGCVLKCHDDLSLFPKGIEGHNKDRQPYHFIVAHECSQVAITGPGIIDGNGYAFWDEPIRVIEGRGETVDYDAISEVYRSPNNKHWWREKKSRPSPLIELSHCQDVRLEGITIKDSPGWTVHPYCCDRVLIRGITIANDLFGPNTDGIDANGCHDVRIIDCDLTCGDDAIILKATDDARSCERVLVTGCTLASNCATLGLGAETTHPIRNCTFTGNVIRQALRAIQIEMWEAGLIENVVITGLTGDSTTPMPLNRAIYIDIQHHGRTDGALGTCRNVTISDVALTTRGRTVLTAADGAHIYNVSLRDVHLTYPAVEHASRSVADNYSAQMSNDSPEARVADAGIVADNVIGLSVQNCSFAWPGDAGVPADSQEVRHAYLGAPAMSAVWLRNCEQVRINAPGLQSFGGAERIHVQAGQQPTITE